MHYLAKRLIIYLHGSENGAVWFTESKKKMSCSRERAFQIVRAQNTAVQEIYKMGGPGYVWIFFFL